VRLDRNINHSGKGKYALINLRKIPTNPSTPHELAAAILANPEAVEFGTVGTPNEFWLIKLKDQYAANALFGYAAAVASDPDGDAQYYTEVMEMAHRSGPMHPLCNRPD
jgi:hypothetical protein